MGSKQTFITLRTLVVQCPHSALTDGSQAFRLIDMNGP